LVLCTGSVGITAMLARLLFLQQRAQVGRRRVAK
jgi:hypothetical protein